MDLTWRAAALVAAGGAIGALARWGLTVALPSRAFPIGTMLANALGSFVLAWLLFGGLDMARTPAGALDARLFLAVGALGAFTTMSTFAYDTLLYLEGGGAGKAALNLAANPLLSLAAAYAGLLAARAWPGISAAAGA